MEHLSLEIFDREGTGSKYAWLPEDASITITDTSEIFASGDVWSHSFSLNIPANVHIFGTSGDLHGSRLHDQINKRKARLWVEGLPLYMGYLMLDDEVDVDENGNVDVRFESGNKTFDEMIKGTKAREVSVGDVVIGVALNRKRVVGIKRPCGVFRLDGLAAYVAKNHHHEGLDGYFCYFSVGKYDEWVRTPYAQRWPKLVKSHGNIYDSNGIAENKDYTNVQMPYDAGHPFCNINICYPLKATKITDGQSEEVAGRGYTIRLAHGTATTDGGDRQTRFNNSPNFYLLHFVDRLFKDLGIHVAENQALNVEDLRRVFMLNYGCHYEEIEDEYEDDEMDSHATPRKKVGRYGQFYLPLIQTGSGRAGGYLPVAGWENAGKQVLADEEIIGKALLRDLVLKERGSVIQNFGSVECRIATAQSNIPSFPFEGGLQFELIKDEHEEETGGYSAYLAYATGENYPNVEISEIVNAMKSMFGIRLIFDSDYSTVRIVLLRNILRNSDVQHINCDVLPAIKQENNIRGFRMTYGKGSDSTSFYYKGFADLFVRSAKIWKDTTDKHDYSKWNLDADYDIINSQVSAFNKTCYVTPVNGNAYGVQVDEDEDVLFPSLFEWAGFMDAEDGDCSGADETVEEIQCVAAPVIMNEINGTYASLFDSDLKAPSGAAQKIGTFARATYQPQELTNETVYAGMDIASNYTISGKLEIFLSEGFQIRMLDNYAISNGGTPFDEADPGLCFGIMRGSGSDAHVRYYEDQDDGEENDAWEIVPGNGAIVHPDTCDSYGNEWDYDGATGYKRVCTSPADAVEAMSAMFPDTHFSLTTRSSSTYMTGFFLPAVTDNTGKSHTLLMAGATKDQSPLMPGIMRQQYINDLQGKSIEQILEWDTNHYNLLIETDSSRERAQTLLNLQKLAYSNGGPVTVSGGTDVSQGRFSLKLRAEKLNPNFDPNRPEYRTVETKAEAAETMTEMFEGSNADLLNRPKISGTVMRAKGWDVNEDGYFTLYGIIYSLLDNKGKAHDVLFTPIKNNGDVLTPSEMENYATYFNGFSMGFASSYDHEAYALMIDIDTSESRSSLLQELQVMYYADSTENIQPISVKDNPRYLDITTPNLRGRGLCDKFYKEYSYWMRNARIARRKVPIGMAQLLSIDKTVRVNVGDITGFILKMQYTVSNKTGLGMVEMDIMYI